MTGNEIAVALWDAFTEQPYTGNPAGVVLQAAGLDDGQMQRIAAELQASETAFVIGDASGVFRLRYFTPSCEVDFCGHATVAAMAALAAAGRAGPAPVELTLACAAGDLPIALHPHAACGVEVIVTQAEPRFAEFGYSPALLAGALGVDRSQIPAGRPLGLAYTGLWALVVPIASPQALAAARPDFAALADLNRKLGCASTHLYTYTGQHSLECRDFSPAVGVSEDPVTGSALGATCALLLRERALVATPPTTVIHARQGASLGRPGSARIEVDTAGDGRVERVRVAGTAVPTLEGRLRQP